MQPLYRAGKGHRGQSWQWTDGHRDDNSVCDQNTGQEGQRQKQGQGQGWSQGWASTGFKEGGEAWLGVQGVSVQRKAQASTWQGWDRGSSSVGEAQPDGLA